ncbi:MAG: hypothetical protein ACXU89_22005, partial [Xanthobacteraceae bacterium]
MKPVVGMVTRRAQKDTPGLGSPAGRRAEPGISRWRLAANQPCRRRLGTDELSSHPQSARLLFFPRNAGTFRERDHNGEGVLDRVLPFDFESRCIGG